MANPPLPPGFELEAGDAGSVPPLPPGFELEGINTFDEAPVRAVFGEGDLNPTQGMSTGDKLLAGAGKSVADTGFGLQQTGAEGIASQLGLLSGVLRRLGVEEAADAIDMKLGRPAVRRVAQLREDEAERRRLDAPLMKTSAGQTGNVVGTIAQIVTPGVLARGNAVGRALLPTTLRGNVLQGTLIGATQPVASDTERATNMLVGAGGGAAGATIPKVAGSVINQARRLAPAVSEKAQERAAARVLDEFARDPDRVRQVLANPTEIIAGSRPTLAEVTEDVGLIGLQRTIRNSQEGGAALAERAREQNLARVRAIQDDFGGADDAAAQAIRDRAAQEGRIAARGLREVRNSDNATGMLVEDVVSLAPVQMGAESLIKRNANRPVVQSALQYVRDLASRPIRSADEAWNLRKTINDLMEGKVGGDQASAQAARRELITLRGLLDREMSRAYPQWGDFLRSYRGAQREANQVEVGQALLDTGRAVRGSTNEPVLTPASFSRAAGNLDRTVARATEFRRATADKILTPKQQQTIDAVRRDLERFSRAEGAGIPAPGSATVANAMGAAKLQDTIGPVGAAMIEPVSGAALLGLNAVRKKFGDQVATIVREAVLDPQRAAEILATLPPRQRTAIVAQVAPLIARASATTGAVSPALAE